MQRFSAAEVLRFLAAVDDELAAPSRLLVIGSTVAMLWSHRVLTLSGDIDVAQANDAAFWSACERVRASLGLPIPVQRYDAFEAPYSYEDRLELAPAALAFHHLQLHIPERHDWALMKTARGYEHDLALIEEVHLLHSFDLKLLLERYREMQFVGSPGNLRLNFLAMIGRLFGEDRAAELEPNLPDLTG